MGVDVEALLVLSWAFLQTNEHSNLSSADNSLISCAITGNSTLFSLDENRAEHLTRCDPGLKWVKDSWGWWTPGLTHVDYASHALCTIRRKKIIFIYSNVIWVSLCFGYLRIQIPRDVSFCIISGQCYGYPLVPYRDTNIPWDLGWCFAGTIFCTITWHG